MSRYKVPQHKTAAGSKAFTVSNVGNLLSPNKSCIVVACRIGVVVSMGCQCGRIVDSIGPYEFSCTRNVGCFPRF